MKKYITVHFVLRIVPLALLALLLVLDVLFCDAEDRMARLCNYLASASVLYLTYPLTREETSKAAWCSAFLSGYYVLAALTGAGTDLSGTLFLLPSAVFLLFFIVVIMRDKYKEPASLFRKDAAWCCAEEDSRLVYAMVLMTALIVLMFLNGEGAGTAPYFIMSLLLFMLGIQLYRRAYTGRTIMISHKKERKIQTIVMSCKGSSDILPEVESSILTKAFRRIEQFMRDRKPYLDDRFTLEKMADILRLNKVYISRAINKFTDKNFRQYINWHRILYSVELMKEDPWLKIIEIAFMSGFHSQVTYNMAFKMFMDENPSDMLMRLRLKNPRPDPPAPSSLVVKLPQKITLPSSQDVRN